MWPTSTVVTANIGEYYGAMRDRLNRRVASYATSPYSGAGEMDIAVEQHDRLAPSYVCTGFLPDPLLEIDAGGCVSLAETTELGRDSILVV